LNEAKKRKKKRNEERREEKRNDIILYVQCFMNDMNLCDFHSSQRRKQMKRMKTGLKRIYQSLLLYLDHIT